MSGNDPRKVDAQFRVSLPDEVLRALGVNKGDWVQFELEADAVHLRRAPWEIVRPEPKAEQSAGGDQP